jgi:hypothetical protein
MDVLMIHAPRKLRLTPPATLNSMYKNPHPACPVFSRLSVSIENAEKVVNPPRMPVTIRSRQPVLISVFSKMPYSIPISKQPTRFTVNVPKGKFDEDLV